VFSDLELLSKGDDREKEEESTPVLAANGDPAPGSEPERDSSEPTAGLKQASCTLDGLDAAEMSRRQNCENYLQKVGHLYFVGSTESGE